MHCLESAPVVKNSIEHRINLILANWNPIGVPDHVALYEYQKYIPKIIKCLNRRNGIVRCLADILITEIGLIYDINNKQQVNDLDKVAGMLMESYHQDSVDM